MPSSYSSYKNSACNSFPTIPNFIAAAINVFLLEEDSRIHLRVLTTNLLCFASSAQCASQYFTTILGSRTSSMSTSVKLPALLFFCEGQELPEGSTSSGGAVKAGDDMNENGGARKESDINFNVDRENVWPGGLWKGE